MWTGHKRMSYKYDDCWVTKIVVSPPPFWDREAQGKCAASSETKVLVSWCNMYDFTSMCLWNVLKTPEATFSHDKTKTEVCHLIMSFS